MNLIRHLNKYFLNPFMLKFITCHGPFAVVNHVGRKSGKNYRTPVIAMPVKNGFMLALTYGKNVDWYKNVLAAKSCVLEYHDKKFQIVKLTEVTDPSAVNFFPRLGQPILKLLKVKNFLKMDY